MENLPEKVCLFSRKVTFHSLFFSVLVNTVSVSMLFKHSSNLFECSLIHLLSISIIVACGVSVYPAREQNTKSEFKFFPRVLVLTEYKEPQLKFGNHIFYANYHYMILCLLIRNTCACNNI